MSNGIASGVPPAAGGAGGAGVCAKTGDAIAITAQAASVIETMGRMISSRLIL
jgi:hypothetical protein